MNEYPDMQDFLNHLTDNALMSLKHADQVARAQGAAYVGTEHILLGILSQGSSVGSKIMQKSGVSYDRAQLALNLSNKSLVISLKKSS